MALDNSAAQNAQSLLNGIDYSALIGAPLQAAITAQAMAARSTWEFIKEVGLTGPDDKKEAVNVSFTYVQNGQIQRLNVPILVIVPIPLIEITDVTIDFKASINASASQATEQSSSSQVAADAEAEAKIGWGPFSLSAKFKASYSSKQDSKATQDSRYSVEYTQNVSVKAGQAGVPAGLAAILQVLTSSVTASSPGGDVTVSPGAGRVDRSSPSSPQQLEIRVTSKDGVAMADHDVKLNFEDPAVAAPFRLGQGVTKKPVPLTDGTATVKTGPQGSVLLQLWLEGDLAPLDGKDAILINITTEIEAGKERSVEFPVVVDGKAAPPPPQLAASSRRR